MRRAFGVLFLAGPFVAGMVAAASARRDFRLLTMAVVATITVWVFGSRPNSSHTKVVRAFVAATATAAAAAVVAGARAPFGVGAVAVVVAAFAAIGQHLLVGPRAERWGTRPGQ